MDPAVSVGTFPLMFKGAIQPTSMLADLFKQGDWVRGLPRVRDRDNPLTVAEDILELLVVRFELLEFSDLSF